MLNSWQLLPFGEICEHSAFGPRFSSDEYAIDGNVACLRTTDIDSDGRIDFDAMPLAKLDLEKLRSHVLRRDDLVITRTGAYLGKVAVFTDFRLPVLPGAFSIRFRLHQRVADPQFIRYYFGSPDGQDALQSIATGSVQPNLNITNLHSLKVSLPSVSEQRRIVEVLAAFDDKIELNRRMNETLEAMARAIFKSWFVDFDPVRAKMDGRQPAGMDAATAALFPDSFDDSDLGHVPHGWHIMPIGQAVQVVGGGTPSTTVAAFWDEGSNHWATPKDLSRLQSPILLDTERKITDLAMTKISSGLLPAGTLLLSSRAPIGYLAIAQMPVAVNQGFIAMIANERISSYFLLKWCQENMDEIERRACGTTFQEISKANFRPIPILVPPLKVMCAFSRAVGAMYQKMVINLQQSRTLAAIRDALLPKLLSGEIRICTGDRITEAAL